MFARIGRLLSFSNVVACLALFVALGGSVYAAGKISGKQIKTRSLPGNRIEPRSIGANRIKPKTLTGRQVKPRSLTGDQINQGTLTKISAAGLAGVQYQALTTPLSSDGTTATADCPPNTYAVGGGAIVSNEQSAFVNDSGPNALRAGWTATGFARFSSGNTMTVTAICVVVRKLNSASSTAPAPPGTSPKYHPAN